MCGESGEIDLNRTQTKNRLGIIITYRSVEVLSCYRDTNSTATAYWLYARIDAGEALYISLGLGDLDMLV